MKKLQTLFASFTTSTNLSMLRRSAGHAALDMHTRIQNLSYRKALYICLMITALSTSLIIVQRVLAAQVTIDGTDSGTDTSHNGSSPTTVFISDQTGYAFYRDASGSCVYSKTTDGGTSWGSAVVVDPQTDCVRIAVWYDRWTPGDNTGTNIHISTVDATDLYYTRLDTSGDTLTTPVNATGANQAGTFAATQNIHSITKGTDGDLYMGIQDTDDSFVIKCTGTCENAVNWTEAGTNPFDLTEDWLILMPLSGGNIMAIRWDTSASDVQSKVYNDALNTWDVAWTNIDTNAPVNLTYDAPFGATLNKSTNTIFLAYAADVSTLGTDDDIRTASYNGVVWTAKTNVLTDDARGITGVKIAAKENTDIVFVLYTARTTAGTANTANVYYKSSTDGMTTFGTEQGPLNTASGDFYGARVNIISDERIYATWHDAVVADLFGNTVADISATAVAMGNFAARSDGRGVLLEWRTGYEVDNLGFNLYREKKNGKRVRVNPSAIAGSAFIGGPGRAMTAGDSYSWFDPQGTADSVYYLEDIDLKGTRTLHGPISPVASNSANIKAGQRQSMMLSEINSQSASTNGASRWQRGWAASVGEGRTLLYSNKPDADRQQPLASQGAVKISVNQRGWYRVTQSDLAAAGFNTNFDPQFLRLFNGNMEVPLLVNAAQRGQFAPGDSFEFYGMALDTLSTDTNTYWLIVGKSKGLRIAARPTQSAQPKSSNSLLQQTPSQGQSGQSGTVQTSPSVVPQRQADSPQMNLGGWFIAPTIVPPLRVKTESDDETALKTTAPAQSTSEPQAAATSATQKSGRRRSRARKPRRKAASRNHAMRPGIAAQSFPYTVELNENLIYISGLKNGETENFFGQVVGGTAATQHLFLENVYQGSGGTALLEIGLQGYTLVGHQVRVKVNGQEVGSLSFNNQEQGSAQFSVPSSFLLEGDNTVTIERTGGDLDVSLVDTIRVTYDHGYRAGGNLLYFSAQGSTRLEGFTNGNIRVIDISDPLRIRELERNVETSNGGFAATVQVPGERYCIAFTDDEVLHPAGIELDKPSNLKSDSQSADLVIISYGGFLNSVQPLAQLRSSQGLKVSVVDVQDVYDEFSYGAHSPHALKDFLSWTKSHWQKAPQFVLLVGDASLDPRNYLGGGETDFVPTKLVDVSTMETASDDWLVDFNNDGAPEMALGRLPARTQAEATGMVSKIVSYSPANVQQQVLMVIDRSNNESFNFQQASTELNALLPSSLTMRTISRGNDTDDSVHNQILSAINEGPLMVNYIGHGSVEVWTGAPILSTTDMSALNNSNRLPVFVMMTCLNGYYQNSARESLAESLLRDSGGAVAVWASSGMTDPASQAAMNQQFYRLLFGTDALTLGEAAQKAKENITDGDVRRTWILFGDPTMKLQ